MIGLDIKKPIKVSHFKITQKYHKFYIIVIVDIFSRYTYVDFITDINLATICDILKNSWLIKFGSPMKLISDNGLQFISSNIKTLMYKYNIKHITEAHIILQSMVTCPRDGLS
ncbi:hypothetical protein DMUE_3383 [Dictyocoela muelleri]|nr:hypothetical protein DMUE_3383 [Dictyocoela muelleri]